MWVHLSNKAFVWARPVLSVLSSGGGRALGTRTFGNTVLPNQTLTHTRRLYFQQADEDAARDEALIVAARAKQRQRIKRRLDAAHAAASAASAAAGDAAAGKKGSSSSASSSGHGRDAAAAHLLLLLAEDDEGELLGEAPEGYEEALWEQQRGRRERAAAAQVAAGSSRGGAAGGAAVAVVAGEGAGAGLSRLSDDDDVAMIDVEEAAEKLPDEVAGGREPAAEGQSLLLEADASAGPTAGAFAPSPALEPLSDLAVAVAAVESAMGPGPLVPPGMVLRQARRLHQRQVRDCLVELGVLNPEAEAASELSGGHSSYPLPSLPAGLAAAAAGAGSEAVKVFGEGSDDNVDANDSDNDSGIVGVGLPRMLGLVPEGNAELASTFAWEDDILWEGAEGEEDAAGRGEGGSGKGGAGRVLGTVSCCPDLGPELLGSRTVGGGGSSLLHPQSMRLEGVPSGLAVRTAAAAGEVPAEGEQHGMVIGVGVGPAAELTSKLRLQPGLARPREWLRRVHWGGIDEGAAAAAANAGGNNVIDGDGWPSPPQLASLAAAAAAAGGSAGGSSRLLSLSLSACGHAPLLLDLSDPGMVFVSGRASELRHAGALVRAAPPRLKPVSGPPMVPDDEVSTHVVPHVVFSLFAGCNVVFHCVFSLPVFALLQCCMCVWLEAEFV